MGRSSRGTGDCTGERSRLVSRFPSGPSPSDRPARWRRGAVAQMGERCNRTAEVRGSIPLSSTSPTHGHSEACRTPGFRRNELPSSAIRHDRNMVAIEHPANVAGPPRQHLIDLLEHFLIVAANADRNIELHRPQAVGKPGGYRLEPKRYR